MKHYIHSYAVFMFFFLMSILCVAGVGENDWKLKNTLEKSVNLKTGMSSAEIEAILGRPDNVDWEKNYAKENVSYRIWLKVEKNDQELYSWKAVVGNSERFGVGHFFILVDDRLLSPIPALTTKDARVLYRLSRDLK